MRRGLVGVGVTALVASGLVAPPAQAAPDVARAATPAPAANPTIEETCGLDATLILDASGSINQAGAVNTVRNASRDLLAALKDTNSTMRITQFGTFSGELSSRVPVNAATTGSGGALATAVNKYYNPVPPRPAGVDIYNGNQIKNTELTWTNWEDGLKGVDRPELAIYMTDGDPTAYNVNANRTNVNVSSSGTALDNAITQANILKNAGTRMLVVGVGSGLTSATSQARLKQISGPQLEKSPSALAGKSINQVDAVAFSDFAALGAFLRSVVTSLCGNSVTIQKLAQTSAGAEYTPATGWDMTVQPTVSGGFTWVDPTGPDNSAQTRATSGAQGTAAFQWKPKQANQSATVNVTETVKTDYFAERWTCDVKAEDGTATTVNGTLTNGNPSFQFQMNPSDVAACKIYNDFDYRPGISITKTPADDPVRGNANGWDEEYRFRVTNTGNTPLTVMRPVDPQCTSITGPTGTGAGTGRLQPGDYWDYTCQAKIGPVPTVTSPLTHDNGVAVTGIAPDTTTVSAQATASVAVKTPRINIAKTAKKTESGQPIPSDGSGSVPAGTKVTYIYTVTNTGNDVLNLARASAVTDDKCSPVDYVSGDTGNDQKLGLTETWVYNCTKVLNPPSTVTSITNTATVTSTWSNPQSRPQNNAAVTDSDRMTINIDRSASLRVVKVTNPGDVDQNFAFTVSGPGVPTPDQSFSLNTSTDPSTPPASRDIELDGPSGGGSQYTITESGVAGWDLTDITCQNGTVISRDLSTGTIVVRISPEQDVTCAYTNERLPTLTISKQTSPNGSPAEFGFTAQWQDTQLPAPAPATFSLRDGQSQDIGGMLPDEPLVITEATVPAGWDLDDISCTGAAFTKDVPAGTVTVTADYGEQADCVFTNAALPPATLTVVKDDVPATWQPNNGFDFTVSGTGLVTPGVPGSDSFSLRLGDSTSYSVRPLAAGNTYRVTEGAQPTPPSGQSGFTLTTISCIVNGGTTVTGNTGTGIVDVPLQPGDNAVCTYVNKQKPRLTIVKDLISSDPADATQFPFVKSQPPAADVPFGLGNGEQTVFTDVATTALTVTETAVAGYTLSALDCSGAGSDALTPNLATGAVTGTLALGSDVVCTYVNAKDPPRPAYLFVLKNTDPAGAPDRFRFRLDGGTFVNETFDLAGGDYKGFEVQPDDYVVTEQSTAGWDLTGIECRVNGGPAQSGDLPNRRASVTLTADDVAVCAFDNQKRGSLTVDKVTDVDSPQQFDFTAASTPDALTPRTFQLVGGGAPRVYSGIAAGNQVTLTEEVPAAPPSRWSLSDIDCSGTSATYDLAAAKAEFTVGPGQDVSCTYSDVQVPPATVQIVKAADPADGTTFTFTAEGSEGGVLPDDQSFSLRPDGDIAVKTLEVYPAASGETFTFTEGELPAAWNLTDIACLDDGQPVSGQVVTGRSVQVPVDPGASITCTFTNRKDATMTVVKEAPDDPNQSFTFEWRFDQQSVTFPLKDQHSESRNDLEPGVHQIFEKNLPADWYLDGPHGAHPTCTGASGVAYDVTLGATVTLAAGDDALCSFADFFDYNPRIELVKSPDRSVVLAGQPVRYSYVATNTGNVDLNAGSDISAALTDDQCDDITLRSGSNPLVPTGNWEFECLQPSVTTDTATNIAEVTAYRGAQAVTARDTVTVDVRVPDLGITKTVNKPKVYPGTQVTYTYVVENLGQTPFEGPVNRDLWVTDNKCSPVTYVSGDAGTTGVLDIGESWTYTCSTSVSVDTENIGTVTATPFLPASPESGAKQTGAQMQADDRATVEVIQKGIDITKTASAPGGVMQQGRLLVPIGADVTYTYDVTSGAATVPMKVLQIVDDKCEPVTYQSGDTNSNGLVDPGETWVYTCHREFTGAQTVTNTVGIFAVEPQLGGLSTDTDDATVVSYKGSIAVKKSPSVSVVAKGSPVTYTYKALNDGTVDLTDVTVTDDKCAPLVYRSGDDGDGIMQVGEEWVYTCTTVLEDDVTNVATATGTTPSGGRVTDSTSVVVLVVGGSLKPAIAVVKKASAKQVQPGGAVTYTYDVTNAGNMPLAEVRVSDDKCSPVTYVSGDDNGDGLLTTGLPDFPDETWVYTCTTKLSKTTTNTATAVGSPWAAGQVVGKDVSATAQATVTVKRVLPITVDPSGKCKGSTCTLVKNSTTNRQGALRYRVRCRPVSSSAAGEVSYCRSKVGKNGRVTVTVKGYRKVKATLWITARPKPKHKDAWKANSWKRTWVLRPKR